ncbi:MAG: exo-alpha-sialidase, partial [Pseudorhodobacter sp.]|nr:exo-alpha-sialidase [Pseudorhodobacter sp.]
MRSPRHVVIHRDVHAYCAHPHMVRASGGALVAVFNMVPRRAVVLHPPEDPMYQNMLIRSTDEGETWSAPEPVPGYNHTGMECAGLTALQDGRLLLNQWQFGWLPAGRVPALADASAYTGAHVLLTRWRVSPEHDAASVDLAALGRDTPWARGPGRCLVHSSTDQGLSFGNTVTVDTAPFSGGYGMRGAVETADGRILLPLSDVPHYRSVFIIESADGCQSWSRPVPVASGDGHEFEEPAILRGQGERLILVLRDNVTRRLHQCISTDHGRSWSSPAPLPLYGYPAHLLRLADGRILLTYGWRQPGYGVRAVLSMDDGATWLAEHTLVIRDGMRNGNLGYPVTLERSDGTLLTLYYGE